MILYPSDDGYDRLFAFWHNANYPARFNYEQYMWLTSVDDGGRYFLRLHQLETFNGVGHEDRPYRE